MSSINNVKKLRRTVMWAALCVSAAGSATAWGATTVDIGTVNATAAGNGIVNAKHINTAAYQAPSKTPLNVSQPTSVISKRYIRHNEVPTSNYAGIIKHTPSVVSISPNGPGMMENMGLSIRGFQDGEFNLTFDGLPIADSNDFTHHSTSYFMAHDIGQVSVDRGPGTAATVGTSTFGGSVSIQSQNPSSKSSFNPYAMVGSFGTQLYGLQYNTGRLPQYNGASVVLDVEKMKTNGYLKNAGLRRENVFFKLVRPISDNTIITVAAMYNQLHQNVSWGATKAQIAQFGPNYALSKDPTKQNFAGYNYDKIKTDFEYIELQSYLGNTWTVDNKVYTYAYSHRGFNGSDPTGGVANTTTFGAGHVPGQKMGMDYRSVGDFLRVAKDMNIGTLNVGLWVDHQYNDRFEYNVDWTLNGALDNNVAGFKANRLLHDTLDNVQPYAEFTWNAMPGLSITPGVKYAWFHRTLSATVNQGSGLPLNYGKSWSAVLPTLDVHYKIQHNWVAYAQVAKGFLAPNLNVFYVVNPAVSSVKPQQTWNYQLGTTWKSPRLTLAADVYYIDFNNKIGKRKVGIYNSFYNQGGVIYKGVELEATYYAGMGFSIYANTAENSAKEKGTGQWIANAPKTTAAVGLMYNRNGLYASLMDKYVGKRYGDSGQTQQINAFSIANASLGYTLKKDAPSWLQKASLNLQVNNLFNNKNINALAGYSSNGNTPLYWTIPGRSYFLTLSAHI